MHNPSIFDRANDWLMECAFPFWSDVGTDRKYGGFVESLTLEGSDAQSAFKRTRVTCRQIYCFSQAEILGWSGAKDLVMHGLEHLTGPAWLGDERGFARRVSRDGKEILDDTPDLYDYAFTLFAFAWAYRATGQEELRLWAERAIDCAEKLLRDHRGRGFWHDATKNGWRQQNPHMHLLEATISAYEAFGAERYASLAKELVTLFRDHLFDSARGILPEFFDSRWGIAQGAAGNFYEPGHQFEWAWILSKFGRAFGLDLSSEIRLLTEAGLNHGIDLRSGLVVAAVSRDGKIVDGTFRTWPNTERLKAACAIYDLDGIDPLPELERCTSSLFKYHLDHSPRGTWVDAFSPHLDQVSSTIPASTLYHLVLGFSEMLRVGRQLKHF